MAQRAIHDSTKLLLSSIELPEDAILRYSIFAANNANSVDRLSSIEAARRRLSAALPTEGLTLTKTVYKVHFQAGNPLLYLFKLAAFGEDEPHHPDTLEGLTRRISSEIPIGEAVSGLCDQDHGRLPCGRCSRDKSIEDKETRATNLAQKLFLEAVRDRLIDEICAASLGKGHIPAVRLRNGFCLVPQLAQKKRNAEWTSKWDSSLQSGVIFCEMQLRMTTSHILIQPVPCRYSGLAAATRHNPYLITGSAVLLLPHGIPAFFSGPYTADDRMVSEFAHSLSHNGVQQAISNEFISCIVPFRRVNEQGQDGGITTVWPRSMVLSMPLGPGLPTPGASPMTVKSTATVSRLNRMSYSLMAMSLQSSLNLPNLSSSLGTFVDSAMKDREKSKGETAKGGSTIPGASMTSQRMPASQEASGSDHAYHAEQFPNGPPQQPMLGSGPAQSYPSPLELLATRVEQVAPISVEVDASQQTQGPSPGPNLISDDVGGSGPTSQANFSTSQNPLNGWDSLGFGDATFGFGTGSGAGQMSLNFDPFAADIFTEDDFGMFDVPTASAPEASGIKQGEDIHMQIGATGASLPDVMLALTGQTQPGETDFHKLDPSLLSWDLTNTTGSFPAIADQNTEGGTSRMDFDFSLDDPQLLAMLSKPGYVPDIMMTTTVEPPPANPQEGFNQQASATEEVNQDEHDDAEDAGFIALRFNRQQALMDEKYASGKYSLPSPPSTGAGIKTPRPQVSRAASFKEDSIRYSGTSKHRSSPMESSAAREGKLRARYMAATHPSRAMIFKLAGNKRFWEVMSGDETVEPSDTPTSSRNDKVLLESPSKKRRLTWSTTTETWRNPTPPAEGSDMEGNDEDGESSGVADDEDWPRFQDEVAADGGGQLTSPSTQEKSNAYWNQHEDPVTLLQVAFDRKWIVEHEIASISESIIPATAFLSPYRSQVPLGPASVPTPVSPDAQLGTSEGVSRLSTALARTIATEACRNPVWRAAVSAMRELEVVSSSGMTRRGVCQTEIDLVKATLQRSSDEEGWTETIRKLAELETADIESQSDSESKLPVEQVQLLSTPKVYIGHGSTIIEAHPSITRFWDQLHLTPLNGPKNVECLALVSEIGGQPLQEQVADWVSKVGEVYEARRLGSHRPTWTDKYKGGVLPVKWDDLRRVCSSLVRESKETQIQPLVVYVVIPNTFVNLLHPAAPQVMGIIAESTCHRNPAHVSFMLIPEVFITHRRTLSQSADFGLDRLASAVYSSFPRSSIRQQSRLFNKEKDGEELVDAYATVLCRRDAPRTTFVEGWPAPTSAMFDRYSFLHVAYDLSSSGEWISTVAATENGDSVESRVSRVDEDDPLGSLVRTVADFAIQQAARADVEWRITISRQGIMPVAELHAWTSELSSRATQVEQAIHLTLLSVSVGDSPALIERPVLDPLPMELLPVRPEETKNEKGDKAEVKVVDSSIFVDASDQVFLVFPPATSMVPSAAESIAQVEFLGADRHEAEDFTTITPIKTCWLMHVPRRAEWTENPARSQEQSVTHTAIHVLYLARFGNSTYSQETTEDHVRSVASSFHDLGVLEELRMGRLAGQGKIPLHLATVASMTMSLDGLGIS